MKRPRRKNKGRPFRGRLRVSPERVSELPEQCSVTEAADVLGVNRRTVYRWILYDGCPADRYWETDENALGRWTIKRTPLVDWLRVTARYKDPEMLDLDD